MLRSRAALAALFALLAAACGNAAAAPVAAPAVPVAQAAAARPAASVELVDRLADQAAQAVASVTGLSVPRAEQRLAGLDVRVVRFRREATTVSAQWPAAGAPQPADGVVVVWLGTPPAPPVVKPQPQAHQTATVTAAQAAPGPLPPAPAAPATPAAPARPGVGSGITPGLEDFVPPPHGSRANIRTLPPAEPGTTMAGRASWYGPGFAGRGTACGTTFDPAEYTLASRELRCGTEVVVTGPGGSVRATVTDWGPAEWTARRFDLSQATMAAIGGLGAGVVDVTVEVR